MLFFFCFVFSLLLLFCLVFLFVFLFICFLSNRIRKFNYFQNLKYLVREASIRLVNGATSAEGRLEIFHDIRWGTVCDDNFDILDGRVACRQLGFTTVARIVTDAAYGIGEPRLL